MSSLPHCGFRAGSLAGRIRLFRPKQFVHCTLFHVDYRSLFTVDSFRVHLLNNRQELSGSIFCDKASARLDADGISAWLSAGNEVARLLNVPISLTLPQVYERFAIHRSHPM